MAGRTISAHVDNDLADTVEGMARREDRKVGHITSAALRFYMSLTPEAQASLRMIESIGTPDEQRRVMMDVINVLARHGFMIAQRDLADHTKHMRRPDMTEEEINEEADRLFAETEAKQKAFAN